jgi:EamA-like transporter family
VQLMAAASAVLPVALLTEHRVAGSASAGALVATIGLVLAGTVMPTSLFAVGQSRVSADVAGAFLNLEPLVGAIMGILLFAEPAGPVQVAGGAAIMTGIGLSTFQVARSERQRGRVSRQHASAEPEATSNAGYPGAEPTVVGAGSTGPRSLAAPGEAPSVVRRTRLTRLEPVTTAHLQRRRFRPAGHPTARPRRERSRRGRSRQR